MKKEGAEFFLRSLDALIQDARNIFEKEKKL